MSRFLSTVLVLLLSVAVCAQERYVTHFLGIPVDGSKTEMIRKLREKGFRASAVGDLEGEFNGHKVYLSVVTNRDKVWRIAVQDATPSSKTGIIIRFNNLCRQFQNNPKYMPSGVDQSIPESEDVSYEITVHDKRYEAAFYQKDPAALDTAEIRQTFRVRLDSMSTLLGGLSLDDFQSIKEQMWEDYWTRYGQYSYKLSVWFMIGKDRYSSSDFRIIMYYDNEYNKGDDGSDL